jgi:hypothetical protein
MADSGRKRESRKGIKLPSLTDSLNPEAAARQTLREVAREWPLWSSFSPLKMLILESGGFSVVDPSRSILDTLSGRTMTRKLDWKVTVEVVGIAAIVVSLIFVVIELRQSQIIAINEALVSLESSAVAARDAVNLNSELWERAAAGEELSPSEALILDNLVYNLSRQAINSYFINLNFSTEEDAIRVRNDFAIFLYRNPGARRYWQAWEEEMIRYRRILEPEISGLWTSWYEEISASLNALDSANQ